ncbi:MAG: serine/threonine protein kinase [Planctomycetaceae bacterium]|nr:serine/threonine protein kinase [Planctomycetaceae bacterium]
MHRCSVVLVLALATQTVTAAEEWSQFRGPLGNGHSAATGLPVQWSGDQNVVWKQRIPGEGWSSPVIHKGRIILTAAVPVPGSEKDYSLQMLTLDATSGAIAANVEVFRQDGKTAPAIHTKNGHSSPTPLVEGDLIYLHWGHQGTACVQSDGTIRWRNRKLDYPPVHGSGGSPVVVGNRLIFSCDGGSDPFVAALDKNTGDVAWRVDRKTDASSKFSFSTPLAIPVGGKTQVISPGSGAVCAYDPEDGREIWRVDYGEGYSVIPRPVFAHGLVYVCTGYGTPHLLAIRPDGNGDVTKTHVSWEQRRAVPHTSSPLVVGDDVYMVSDNGVASCLDAKTGKQHWQQRLSGGGGYSASLLYGDRKIYFQSETGVGNVIRASRQFELLSTNTLGERTLASYGVTQQSLLIRSAENLYRIGKVN